MREIISEYGFAIVGAIGTIFIIGLIAASFMNGGVIANTLLGFLNSAF
ncbi:MAG: hypothetical protein ACI4FX_02990 [Agathobacter sp.]